MVANKRSKQQMIDDLNLFLGSHTSVFVNWLHQVLQKLQEVTLPANGKPFFHYLYFFQIKNFLFNHLSCTTTKKKS